MHSQNEWSKLKKVIVGIADNAKLPPPSIDVRAVNYADVKELNAIRVGPYPDKVIQEANEDLEIFCDFYKKKM